MQFIKYIVYSIFEWLLCDGANRLVFTILSVRKTVQKTVDKLISFGYPRVWIRYKKLDSTYDNQTTCQRKTNFILINKACSLLVFLSTETNEFLSSCSDFV